MKRLTVLLLPLLILALFSLSACCRCDQQQPPAGGPPVPEDSPEQNTLAENGAALNNGGNGAAENSGENGVADDSAAALRAAVSLRPAQESYFADIPTYASNNVIVAAQVLDGSGKVLPDIEVSYTIDPAYSGVDIRGTSGMVTIQAGAAEGTVNIVASYATLEPINIPLILSTIETYTYAVHLEPDKTSLKAGETLLVEVMLEGELNYTQVAAEIAYDTSLLKYTGYANLQGMIAVCAPLEPNLVALRCVAGSDMVKGEPCSPAVRLVTLKFTAQGGLSADSLETDITFATVIVGAPAGIVGAATAPSEPLTITLRK